jgi:predicted GNAT family acetyltransferase
MGRLFIWDDCGPVSVAKYVNRTLQSATIGLLYTPLEHRRRKYGSACVAALTERLLTGGFAVCYINTDLTNPITNRMYPAMGFRPVCDMSNIDLTAG